MFPEEWLYTAASGTVGTQSLPREAVGSSPQYLQVGSHWSLAHPWRVIQGVRTWFSVPAGRGHLQHGVAAPWVVLWVTNVLPLVSRLAAPFLMEKLTLFTALRFVITTSSNLCCLLCTQEDEKDWPWAPSPHRL